MNYILRIFGLAVNRSPQAMDIRYLGNFYSRRLFSHLPKRAEGSIFCYSLNHKFIAEVRSFRSDSAREDNSTSSNAVSSSGFTSTIRTFCFHLYIFFSRSTDQETIPPLTECSQPPSPATHLEMEAKMYPESCSLSLPSPPSTPPLQEPAPPCPDMSETTKPKSNWEGILSDPKALHPIFILLREEQLGRHILVLAIPMITGLFSFYNMMKDDPMKHYPLILRFTALSLSFGVTLIWNGILLRRTFNRFSLVLELLGVAFMLSAFFSFVGWFLPLTMSFIPLVCWVLCLLPFAISFYTEEASEMDKDSGCCLAV